MFYVGGHLFMMYGTHSIAQFLAHDTIWSAIYCMLYAIHQSTSKQSCLLAYSPKKSKCKTKHVDKLGKVTGHCQSRCLRVWTNHCQVWRDSLRIPEGQDCPGGKNGDFQSSWKLSACIRSFNLKGETWQKPRRIGAKTHPSSTCPPRPWPSLSLVWGEARAASSTSAASMRSKAAENHSGVRPRTVAAESVVERRVIFQHVYAVWWLSLWAPFLEFGCGVCSVKSVFHCFHKALDRFTLKLKFQNQNSHCMLNKTTTFQ